MENIVLWTEDEIVFLTENAQSGINFLMLNLNKTKRQIQNKALKLKIIIKSNRRKITKELLESIIPNCDSYSGVCRALNKTTKGGIYELIKNRIKEYDIDISHFTFSKQKINKPKIRKLETNDILVNNNSYRVSHNRLKKCLLQIGVLYQCSECEISDWKGKPMTLDIDHINGDWSDCRKENLRFLCPNCHRQTDTFGAKNIKVKKNNKELKRIKNYLTKKKIDYNKLTEEQIIELRDSFRKEKIVKEKKIGRSHLRKAVRPPYEELKQEVKENGYSATGRKYGVSDNAIRKWIKIYEKSEN